MGIRIHKRIGYGLQDVTGADDPRFTKNIYDLMEEIHEVSLESLCTKIDTLERGLYEPLGSTFKYRHTFPLSERPASFLTYEDEGGLSNVVLFTPIMYPDWQRYDDIIDYMDAVTSTEDGPGSEVREFSRGIYPFDSYMDRRTGRTVNRDFSYYGNHHNPDEEFPKRLLGPVRYDPRGLDFAQYATWGEAQKNTVPKIPLDITLLCRAFNVFRSDSTILQLRPMLYTYWG